MTLLDRLRSVEGWAEFVYVDTTSNLTIGYGHNLAGIEIVPAGTKSDVRGKVYPVRGGAVRLHPVHGISKQIGDMLLEQEVLEVREVLQRQSWYNAMNETRQDVLVELVFNIGPEVIGFKNFVTELRDQDYVAASRNMETWLWRRQVGDGRALPLIRAMATGERQ